jgi:hypothetical protein
MNNVEGTGRLQPRSEQRIPPVWKKTAESPRASTPGRACTCLPHLPGGADQAISRFTLAVVSVGE